MAQHAKGKLESTALKILKFYPQIKEQPASLSGKYHLGETVAQHLERCASVMRHLCDGMNIHDEDRDMLIACAYLHDLGLYTITQKGKVDHPNWHYYEKTGWSRIDTLMKVHPIISANILDEYKIGRREEIKRIISVHMGHWYKNTPKPKNKYEHMMVMADYLSTRSEELFDFTGENKK